MLLNKSVALEDELKYCKTVEDVIKHLNKNFKLTDRFIIDDYGHCTTLYFTKEYENNITDS